MPSYLNVERKRGSKRRDGTTSSPKLTTKRARVPTMRYQEGYDMGSTNGRFESMHAHRRRTIGKKRRVFAAASASEEEEEQEEPPHHPPPPSPTGQSAVERLQTDAALSGCYGVTITGKRHRPVYIARVRRGSATRHVGSYASIEEAAAMVLTTAPGRRFARQKRDTELALAKQPPPSPDQLTDSGSETGNQVRTTGRAAHWSATEDAKLHAVMKHLLGKERYGANSARVKPSVWRAVARAMGHTTDVARGARRCLRHWFLTDPSNTAVASEMRKRDNEAVRRRKQRPPGTLRKTASPRQTHTPIEDDGLGNDAFPELFGTEGCCDALFPDLEEVSVQAFADLCFENPPPTGLDLTTDETLSPECDEAPVVVDRKHYYTFSHLFPPLVYTFASTNLGRRDKVDTSHNWKRPHARDTTTAAEAASATTATAAAAAVASKVQTERPRPGCTPPPPPPPARAQSPSPPAGWPVATSGTAAATTETTTETTTTTPLRAMLAPPMVQETLDSYLRICKGLASVDPKTLVTPSARLLMKEFETAAMRVVVAASAASPPQTQWPSISPLATA